MTLTVPATPLPCALESAWQAHRGGSFLIKECDIIVSIHYCEGGRQMASIKLLVNPESLCIPNGTHNKLTESRVSG